MDQLSLYPAARCRRIFVFRRFFAFFKLKNNAADKIFGQKGGPQEVAADHGVVVLFVVYHVSYHVSYLSLP